MRIPTNLLQFSFGVRELNVKMEKDGWDQLGHFHPAQI